MSWVNLKEVESLARETLPADVWDYVAGGAEDEHTIADNRAAFQGIKLRPRVLRGVSTCFIRTGNSPRPGRRTWSGRLPCAVPTPTIPSRRQPR
jgi:hypothetical protein